MGWHAQTRHVSSFLNELGCRICLPSLHLITPIRQPFSIDTTLKNDGLNKSCTIVPHVKIEDIFVVEDVDVLHAAFSGECAGPSLKKHCLQNIKYAKLSPSFLTVNDDVAAYARATMFVQAVFAVRDSLAATTHFFQDIAIQLPREEPFIPADKTVSPVDLVKDVLHLIHYSLVVDSSCT